MQKELIAMVKELVGCLQWCGGSDDFADGGKSREGWLKGPVKTMAAADDLIKSIEREIDPCKGTTIYGASDDLIEFDGEYHGEVGTYGTDDGEKGVLIFVSDGSVLEVKYNKLDLGIWGIRLIASGHLFDRIDPCMDPDAKTHSDTAYFRPGVKWIFASRDWEIVK